MPATTALAKQFPDNEVQFDLLVVSGNFGEL